MTDDTQPEAMDLADWLEAVGGGPSAKRCAALLREQHTRITELESQLAQAADSVPAVEREQERIAFKDAHRHLDLDEVPDAWGRPMFKHSHVEASWLGWIARASRGQAPATAQADSELEAQLAQRFDAADMATAEARGFRDGVASVAANAGSEPIAWLVCTEEGDPSMVFLDQREAQMFLEDDERPTPLYTHHSPTSAEGVEHG